MPPTTLSRAAGLWWLPGAIGVCLIVLLVGLPFVALLLEAHGQFSTDIFSKTYIRRVIWFSFYQATLSTALALFAAIPLSLALARRTQFRGRGLLLSLFSLSLIIPTVVAVFGIVAVYGRNGWLVNTARHLGWELEYPLYGLVGILLAHVFFNLPLATRVFLQSLETIPTTTWRLAAQLGLQSADRFRIIEWPAIRPQIHRVALLIFSLCFTSFAIVMTLGGGPASTTIEVAIYQAVRFDFDIPLAISLALVQMALCIALMFILTWRSASNDSLLQMSGGVVSKRYAVDSTGLRIVDYSVIAIGFLFVLLPLSALLTAGFNPALAKVLMHESTLRATINTLTVALLSGLLSVLLALLLLSTSTHLSARMQSQRSARVVELTGMTILIVPPVVLGTGLFILLRPFADVFSLALLLVILVNALMGLPFVLRLLSTPMLDCARNHDRLCASLGVHSWHRLSVVEWPALRKPVGLALALASTLSAGDFTVIALFGSERMQTLPLLLYRRMGSYQMQDAASTALLLLLVCLGLFWLTNRVVGGRHA